MEGYIFKIWRMTPEIFNVPNPPVFQAMDLLSVHPHIFSAFKLILICDSMQDTDLAQNLVEA